MSDDDVTTNDILNKIYKYGDGKEKVLFNILRNNERVIQFNQQVMFLSDADGWTMGAVIDYFSLIKPVIGILIIGNGFQLTFSSTQDADWVIRIYKLMITEALVLYRS